MKKCFIFFVFFCEVFWCWWLVWLYPHTLCVPSVTHPYTSRIYLGVTLLPSPPHTHRQPTSQEWWFRLIWLNSLDRENYSNDRFTTVWSALVSSLPDRFLSILKWFMKRPFFLFFFATRLWQSVTLLIGDIRCSVKANDQTKNKLNHTIYYHHGQV